MSEVHFPTDRKINSTENNGYAEGVRDETEWFADIVDTEIPDDDLIPDAVDETGVADNEVYNEQGYDHLDP